MISLPLLSVFVLLVVLIFRVLKWHQSRQPPKGLRPVPGPKGLPFIGNIHQLKPQPQRQMEAWAKEYGELFQVQLGWNTWVYLCSPESVKEIMDRQSAKSSSRTPSPVVSDLVSGGMRFLFMENNEVWRKIGTIVHKLLSAKATNTFKPSQEFEAKQLVHDILTKNTNEMDFYQHVRRYTSSVVMTSTYGKRIPRWECEEIREVYQIMHEFSEYAGPTAWLAEAFPPLAKIPIWMQWWRKRALVYYKRQEKLWLRLFRELKAQMDDGIAPECFVKRMMESSFEKEGISELQAAFLCGSIIEAGSETTSSALNSCIKYLGANPTVQSAAHEELDRMIGDARSPTFEDEESLPYIRAIVKEVQRIRPVTTIGTPHYTTEDIQYRGRFIPKGTVVSICQYAIHFDPRQYDEPKEFRPERYLNFPLKAGTYAVQADPRQRDHFSFGAGRRICPGMHLAENSLFITIAKILWAFEILPPSGLGDCFDIDVSDAAYQDGADTVPKPYRMRFKPRNSTIYKTIEQEWNEAERGGFYLGNVKVDKMGIVIP
ncbi:putative O-methylsterigmatocystin oxidoreductase [Rhizodiscina lignyota]|uniref:O-methylsterigmatocystin oxidoreductase n=1 Tax=Rhizodiscina lignyota TaxID=1504668 RepID=A0A9P4IFA6_9PEZI|nr:putative O-methylsterigmatocystin oxidoreductase [Rhizodiscina lignyota]